MPSIAKAKKITEGEGTATVGSQEDVLADFQSLMSDLEREKAVASSLTRRKPLSPAADAGTEDFSIISRMVSKSQSLPPPLPVDLSEMQTRIGPEMGSGVENNVHDVLTNREKYNLEPQMVMDTL